MLSKTDGIPVESIFKNCLSKSKKIGFPLFMRTDNSSVKHSWKETCYVPSEDVLKEHIMELLTVSELQGWMTYKDSGLFFRELLELEVGHKYGVAFTAFDGGFPVNKERRYFIRNGKVQCHHPYWYPDAIVNPSFNDYEDVLTALNTEESDECFLLKKYAEQVAKRFPEYWSVDFAEGINGKWYLIDMARGEDSFHWLECEYCSEEMRSKYEEG